MALSAEERAALAASLVQLTTELEDLSSRVRSCRIHSSPRPSQPSWRSRSGTIVLLMRTANSGLQMADAVAEVAHHGPDRVELIIEGRELGTWLFGGGGRQFLPDEVAACRA